MAPTRLGTSTRHWLFRGLLAGTMVSALFNALSYFFRSGGWGGVLGNSHAREAIGFPMEFWQIGCYYGGFFIDPVPWAIDIACALAIGLLCGVCLLTQTHWLNKLVDDIYERTLNAEHRPFQFSIGSLMLATVPVALLFAAARTERVEVLAGIYLFGPTSLVVLAMLPRGLSWETRVVLLTPMAISLIGFAVWIGHRLGIEFDKVLLGIFACWVPQSAKMPSSTLSNSIPNR